MIKSSKETAERALCLRLMLERARLESLVMKVNSIDFDHPAIEFMGLVNEVGELMKDKEKKTAEQLRDFKNHAKGVIESDINNYLKMIENLYNLQKEWVSTSGMSALLSPEEKKLFESEPGTWTQQQMFDTSWRMESLGVLLWAMEISDEIPPYDVQFSDEVKLEAVPFLDSIEEFVKNAKMRNKKEINKARNVAEMWNWRSCLTILEAEGKVLPPEGSTYAEVIKKAAKNAQRRKDISKPIDGDFPLMGKAFRDLTEEEYPIVSAIATERHFALNWLCDYSDNWDDTPTET